MKTTRVLRTVVHHPMNAANRWAALMRFIRWQVGSRLLPGMVALPFVGETKLFTVRGMTGATGNWYCGLHEHAEMAFTLHVLRPGDHFLDVGANVGSYTVLAAGGTGCRVTAVEPLPATFAALRTNIVLNNLEDIVRMWCGALSHCDSLVRFTSDLDTMNHVSAQEDGSSSIEVPVQPLDKLVGQDVPLLIKIDVEGYEWPVLRGAARVLEDATLRAVIMETNESGKRYGVSDDCLFEEMERRGFRPMEYDPFNRKLRPLEGRRKNTIFVRDLDFVHDRIRTAKRFRLVNGDI